MTGMNQQNTSNFTRAKAWALRARKANVLGSTINTIRQSSPPLVVWIALASALAWGRTVAFLAFATWETVVCGRLGWIAGARFFGSPTPVFFVEFAAWATTYAAAYAITKSLRPTQLNLEGVESAPQAVSARAVHIGFGVLYAVLVLQPNAWLDGAARFAAKLPGALPGAAKAVLAAYAEPATPKPSPNASAGDGQTGTNPGGSGSVAAGNGCKPLSDQVESEVLRQLHVGTELVMRFGRGDATDCLYTFTLKHLANQIWQVRVTAHAVPVTPAINSVGGAGDRGPTEPDPALRLQLDPHLVPESASPAIAAAGAPVAVSPGNVEGAVIWRQILECPGGAFETGYKTMTDPGTTLPRSEQTTVGKGACHLVMTTR